jgi:branched-chain amino acid transport system ATP-binding protein
MSAQGPLLAVEDLSISFGGLAALTGVSFDVAAGEVAALIGPNGAGKTTVFNVLTGLYPPTRGRAVLDGEDLLTLAPHEIARRGVARTFQNTEVFRRLSVLDNVMVGEHTRLTGGVLGGLLGSRHVRREEAEARRRAEGLLARVGLADVAAVDAASLPLGRQKRLEIARALALGPRLLLLDEPAGGLNPTETRELMQVIGRLRDEDGVAILIVEHNMELVMGISERIVVLHYGRKLAEGTPREVARSAAVIEAYLGAGDEESDDGRA